MFDLSLEEVIFTASWWRSGGLLALAMVMLTALVAVPRANAADRIYWSNLDDNGYVGSIAWANLNGNGVGGKVNTTGATVDAPMGMTLDPSHGKIYWANWAHDAGTIISYANLDGSGGGDLDIKGATIDAPHGLAIDPSIGPAGRLYWPNAMDNSISYADLDGHGGGVGGDLQITNATLDEPRGMTIDPKHDRLLWSNYSDGGSFGGGSTISYVNLGSGGGDGDLIDVGMTGDGPEGTAIDPVTNKIFWSDFGAYYNLAEADNKIGGVAEPFWPGDSVTLEGPHGVAVDPDSRRLYWANYTPGVISYADLGGGNGHDLDTPHATTGIDGPNLPSLLKAPVGTNNPTVSGGAQPGAVLSCSRGGWAGDVLESLMYRAPTTVEYQWLRDGQTLPGADSKQITASTDGGYRCRVTARNAAGAASQASAVHQVATTPPVSNHFTFGKVKRNRRKGTARIAVELPGAGQLAISGAKIKAATKSAAAAGEAWLPVHPLARAGRTLARRGKLRVHLAVTFSPTGGSAKTRHEAVRLRQRVKRKR